MGATIALVLLLASPSAASPESGELVQVLAEIARPLRDARDLAPLLEAAADARLVLLGEASHGTHEFYAWRDRMTRRLVAEQGFSMLAIEGEWVSLLPLDRYVRHAPDAPASARAALQAIDRWPRWVWANREFESLAEWLRGFNADRPPARRVGVHGIDLYAIWESLDAVQAFYASHLVGAAPRTEQRYRLLRQFRERDRAYAEFVRTTGRSAETAVAEVANELDALYRRARAADRDVLFEVLQHARVVQSGERYLRLLPSAGPYSWNARAEHLARSVDHLLAHHGDHSRAIVWAHNTHVGDARATDMRRTGEVNLGQLVRQRYGRDAVFVLGFGGAHGSVFAAHRWDGPGEVMQLSAPRPDSVEAALLAAGSGDRLLLFDPDSPATRSLLRALPHRAVGVVYDAAHDGVKHYMRSCLPQRYDAFAFLPATRALEPLQALPGGRDAQAGPAHRPAAR